jgi:hypothetical protein
MTAAIFGLLGVIVGALVNGGVASIVRREARRGERRVAARLVLAELDALETTLSVSSDARVALEDFPLDTDAWHANSAVIAHTLNHSEWSRVSGAYGMLHMLNSVMRDVKTGDELDDEQVHHIETIETHVMEGCFALKPFAEGWDPKLDQPGSDRAYRRAIKASNRRRP